MSWVFSGNLGLVVIEFVEVEEHVKDSAFYWWVVWASKGFASEDSEYEKREVG